MLIPYGLITLTSRHFHITVLSQLMISNNFREHLGGERKKVLQTSHALMTSNFLNSVKEQLEIILNN